MILEAIAEARLGGARLGAACRIIGLPARTIQRWLKPGCDDDGRRGPNRRPPNALTPAEETQVVAVLTSARYSGVSPKQLVPQLADEGLYLASESTMYRLQRRLGLRATRPPLSRTHVSRACTVHSATGPNQVWSWDITWLPTTIRGKYLYLYLVMDVWSRRIVGWTIEDSENSTAAAALVRRICADENLDPDGLILHSDNGKAMRGATMLSTLQWLGIVPSFSRPHVSDDNPYSEALFRTLKHTPAYPRLPFADHVAATRWVSRFVAWYNGEHRHSAIRYVTPDERHCGDAPAILASRHKLYQRARRTNPERWSRATRNWTPVGTVVLNPQPAAREQLAA